MGVAQTHLKGSNMSLPNIVAHMQNIEPQTPERDMGATKYNLNDRSPYTVVEVINKRECIVQKDKCYADQNKECPMGHQNWVIERNPYAEQITINLRKDGKWREKGVPTKDSGSFWILGGRDPYRCWEI
jgi:hypothetical protein